MDSPHGKRIAIIGSGISGLSAAWLLHRNGAKVTLYESEATFGGHTLTDDTSGFPVDLGFQVFNLTTYPHMVAFLEALGIDSEPSDMSFSLSVDSGKLEWASHNLSTIFAQRSNIASLSFLSMIRDVLRFGREAPKVLDPASASFYNGMTLGEYLNKNKYSKGFINNYVLPMCAAVWSVSSSRVLTFPVTMLIRFWVNHHLLDVVQRPCWRVVKGRSRAYVTRVIAELPDTRSNTPVFSVQTSTKKSASGNDETIVTVHASDGVAEYDAAVMATHADISARLLEKGAQDTTNGVDPELLNVLKGVPYADNDVWLHADPTLMPKDRSCWASWNCISRRSGSASTAEASMDRPVCVSYWINHLQSLPIEAPELFVTLNPVHPPASDRVLRHLTLAHPIFGEASVAAQAKLPSVQGRGGIYLSGAWCGYGFHEDGIKSAVDVVQQMGGTLPWIPRACSPKISWIDSAAKSIFDKFARAAIVRGRLRFILPNGEEMSYGTPEPAPHTPADAWRNRPPLDVTVQIYNMAFFRKVISRHDTGLGESYMDGDYEIVSGLGGCGGDLGSLIAVATANARDIEGSRGLMGLFNAIGERALTMAHRARSNTVAGSRRNIEEHYDAGNDMYRLFLDETMTYSCGIWDGGNARTLYESQINKIDALIDKAEISSEHHILEIGCGWGAFALRCVERTGCRVTGLTLSKEQLAEATARVKAAGLQDRITFLYCDYRDTPDLGTYDRVVSCEMIEAVGHEHLNAYFITVGAALKQGGRAVIQVIAEPDERYEEYCASSDFIREHIFPGGHLPSVGACVESSRRTGLSLHGCDDIGPDYAVTLRAWRQAWEERKEEVLALGYSERFWRKYQFYFAYCEAAFDAKYIHTFQMTWIKDRPPTLTEADVSRALEQSKGGFVVAPATAVASSSAAQVTPVPLSSSSDVLTQVLMALYFFLAGAAVSTSAILWLLPLATATSALAFAANGAISRLVLPFYSTLSSRHAALWNLQAVHIIYSACAAFCAVAYVVSNPRALLLGAPQPSDALPSALAAASAGFFGFILWAEVHARLYKRSYTAIIHYTVLLVVFCAAAHKSVNTPFLCVTLLSEINSIFLMARKQAVLCDIRSSSTLMRVLSAADKGTFFSCRLLPHAILGIVVLLNPQAFSSLASYWLAVLGMVYMNARNAKHTLSFLGTAGEKARVKQHAA